MESGEPEAEPLGSAEPASVRALEPAISDFKRNWTDITILALVRAWRAVYRSGRAKDEKTTMFNERIFVAYQAAVPSTQRSKKAIEDKLQGLREMYRFISDVSANRVQGSTGKAEWFDLSKQDKKELSNLRVQIDPPEQNAPPTFELSKRTFYTVTCASKMLVEVFAKFIFCLRQLKCCH
ncbi:hypothetical protein PInf_021910 [Phytophthora infestans]|nr:hypothetical protein PInf_021910 [Phytophthora infestans]